MRLYFYYKNIESCQICFENTNFDFNSNQIPCKILTKIVNNSWISHQPAAAFIGKIQFHIHHHFTESP